MNIFIYTPCPYDPMSKSAHQLTPFDQIDQSLVPGSTTSTSTALGPLIPLSTRKFTST